MGSVLSSAHAALCSLVDKVMMRRLMASFPHPPGMTTEQVEPALRRLLDEPKREDPPHPDAPPPYAPAAFLLLPRDTYV